MASVVMIRPATETDRPTENLDRTRAAMVTTRRIVSPGVLDAQKRRKRLRQPVDEFARQPIEPRICLLILIYATSSDLSDR